MALTAVKEREGLVPAKRQLHDRWAPRPSSATLSNRAFAGVQTHFVMSLMLQVILDYIRAQILITPQIENQDWT